MNNIVASKENFLVETRVTQENPYVIMLQNDCKHTHMGTHPLL